MKNNYHDKQINNVLSVGCGDAEQDMLIINNLQINNYTMVEPCQEYKSAIENNLNEVNKETNILLFLITLEEFCLNIDNFENNHFDLIIMSHVLYYIKDYVKYVNMLKRYCKNIIIYHQSDKSVFYEIQQSLSELNISSVDIENKLNILERHMIKCTLNLDCLDNDMIKFLIGTSHLNDQKIKEIKEKIHSYTNVILNNQIEYYNDIFVI